MIHSDVFVNMTRQQFLKHANGSNILIAPSSDGPYPFTPGLYKKYKDVIMHELAFGLKTKAKVERVKNEISRKVNSSVKGEPIFVGIHSRRTDYANFLRKLVSGHLPSTAYFTDAMDRFRSKYGPRVQFLWASDDLQWGKRYFGHLGDVHFVRDFLGEDWLSDFSVLASCDHFIFRYFRVSFCGNKGTICQLL